ncbi:MAG: ATP-binding protein [Streptomyces sp.]|jgi:anti-sigma regulatory factor (Ser/Thr protein kinase)|uniref:ATP-binding protein n=1 Tax=Streptomyces sp. TaxID=1931 RepID=UPI0025FE7010|nr:ATP-binding protein [Streptomyces sp.]MBW8798324.1 ATP-binding protein [Streptomyces sp.]
MVTPLKNRASDGHEPGAPLRYSATWASPDTPVSDARVAVRELLARAGHHPHHRPSQDAQLVVSELVTNAVRHAPGPVGLVLEVSPDAGLLRITVSDTSPRTPEPRPRDPHRVGGHGLNLVARLCGRLYTVTQDTGKHVVAHLHLRRPASPEP